MNIVDIKEKFKNLDLKGGWMWCFSNEEGNPSRWVLEFPTRVRVEGYINSYTNICTQKSVQILVRILGIGFWLWISRKA